MDEVTGCSPHCVTVRPPMCMASLEIFDSEYHVFIVFSPYPAPDQNELGITFHKSIESIAHRLCDTMPARETQGGNLNRQARLLSNCTNYALGNPPAWMGLCRDPLCTRAYSSSRQKPQTQIFSGGFRKRRMVVLGDSLPRVYLVS